MYMIETKMLPVRCASMSLIAIFDERRPVSWGNYFWLYYDEKMEYDEVRIINMWWENLEALSLQNGVVEVKIYTDPETKKRWGIITDQRVPPKYLYNKLCFTGYSMPSKEIARDMYDLLGDPENEFEQYTDPVSYWDKRGGKYNPETGIVSSYPNFKREKNNAIY